MAAGVGVVVIVVAVLAQQTAPHPTAAGRIDPATPTPSSPPASKPATPSASLSGESKASAAADHADKQDKPLPRSVPVHLDIPKLDIHTKVNPIGKNPDGSLAVPQPGPHLNQAAWYKNSPTPGQPGPAIIEGHVDSVQGPSVFFKLGAIKPGDKVKVTRADGTRLAFTVNAVRDFKKKNFPTKLVYGGKDLSTPQLRLITCSDFVEAIHHHVGNEVVFTHLTEVHKRG